MAIMALELWPHQIECIQDGKQKNIIASIPTGRGKTLIAVKLIDHYLNQFPKKKVAFLVPTRPLVEQQATYCERHCENRVIVERVFGEEQSTWTQQDWRFAFQRSNIFLGTAALFQKIFVTERFLSLDYFCLLVFDECHHCVGNSPMASVMRDAIAPHYQRLQNSGSQAAPPRILGLTASIVNGSLKNVPKERQALEARLLSTIVSPNVPTRLEAENFTKISWEPRTARDREIFRRHEEAINSRVREAVDAVANIKEIAKVIRRCTHVYDELGFQALKRYIQHVIVAQVVVKIDQLDQMEEVYARRAAANMRNSLPILQATLGELWQRLEADLHPPFDSFDRINGWTNSKVDRLLTLLNDIFTSATGQQGQSSRGIIFVKQIALVSPLAFLVNEYCAGSSDGALRSIRCGAIAGVGSQTNTDRQGQLDDFRSGEIHILVSTAALEEGTDVPECAFVIRFNPIDTTKAHIQGSGRARHSDAQVYYFENDPDQELQNERIMNSVARDTSLQLSMDSLRESAATMNMSVDNRHPYPFGSRRTDVVTSSVAQSFSIDGEVNVYNCKQLLNQYCSFALGQSVSPKIQLYQYQSRLALNGKKVLLRIRYPTPSGWKMKSNGDYNFFWNGVDMSQVFGDSERIQKKSASEKEEMMFVYIVVVELREQGFLDSNNKPTSDSSFRTSVRLNCPLTPVWETSDFSLRSNMLF